MSQDASSDTEAVETEKETESVAAATPTGETRELEQTLASIAEEGVDAPTEAEPEKKTPDPDAAALRRKELEARIARAEAKASAAREAAKFKAEREELERLRAAVTKDREEAERRAKEVDRFLEDLRKSPVSAFRRAGIQPEVAYEAITNEVLKRETPESKEEQLAAQLLERFRKETEPKLSKVEELERTIAEFRKRESEREAREFAMAETMAKRDFLRILSKPGHEILADYYEEDELLALGDQVAAEFIQSGNQYGSGSEFLEAVARELNSRVSARHNRIEDRRSKRSATTQSAASQTAPAEVKTPASGPPAKKPAQTAIGTDMASASATVVNNARPKNRKALLAEAANEIPDSHLAKLVRP